MGKNIGEITLKTEAMLSRLGANLRHVRKSRGLSSVVTSLSAGISRTTLARIEKGESSVTAGAYFSVANALGEEISLVNQSDQHAELKSIRIADFPGFKQIAWHLKQSETIAPEELWGLFSRNERYLDWKSLGSRELAYLSALIEKYAENG